MKRLFITGFIQVYLVAANTVFIAKGLLVGIIAASFGISYTWTHNVKRAAMGSEFERLIYCAGATTGAVCGYFSGQTIFKLF